jgi:hypothetical protein
MKRIKNHTRHWTLLVILLIAAVAILFITFDKSGSHKTVSPDIQRSGKGVTTSSDDSSGTQPCKGNTAELCVLAPTVDFWPSGDEGASNTSYSPVEGSETKEIGGIIVTDPGATITIQATSGRTFAIIFPADEFSWWNQVRSPNYNNYQIGTGDTLTITYSEPASDSKPIINSNQIISSSLAIKSQPSKTDPTIERYPSQ